MEWYLIALILFGGLLFLLALGLPVAFAIGLASFVGIFLFIGPQGLGQIVILMVHFGTEIGFVVVPLFILFATFLSLSGAASGAFNLAQKWLNWLPGSLGVSTTVACGIFGAACGTSTGGAAAMGRVTIPELLKCGYSRPLTLGMVAAGGTLSILIPPSGIMILYCIITEQSIGKMFIAGVVPGIMMVGLFSAYIIIYALFRPQLAPSLPHVSWRERLESLRGVWAMLAVILFVLGAIYTGIATVTEAAAIGCVASLAIALVYKALKWPRFKEALLDTARVTCFIFFIIFSAMTFGYLLSYLRIPFELSELIARSQVPPMGIIAMIMALYIILGCFLDPASILVLTMPVLFPVVQNLGFNPIWFGILATINMELGNITPPVGLNLFVIKSVTPGDVSTGEIIRGVAPFMGILALGLILVMLFPDIALWLPGTMMGK